MTDSDGSGGPKVLKRDAAGRVRTSPEHREALLDAFEQGGLSGPDFARVHGIKYQTFATWRQKRRQQRGAPEDDEQESGEESFALVEVGASAAPVPAVGDCPEGVLKVDLPGGGRLMVMDEATARLAASVLAGLEEIRSVRERC